MTPRPKRMELDSLFFYLLKKKIRAPAVLFYKHLFEWAQRYILSYSLDNTFRKPTYMF
jgi:hypothetical protein